jgi:uncharacterized protein (UPF0548 family)
MARYQPIGRRWATAARWPLGVALASWRYLWSTTPVHRWQLSGDWPEDAPPRIPGDADSAGLQRFEDGTGPLVHRLYRTRIVGSAKTPERLMEAIVADLDRIAPSEFATFQKIAGDEGRLRVGDEYVVRMPGPWDGPVRVLASSPTSFRLATLPGHLEAGQIEFRLGSDHRSIEFEIESWARSGDRFSDLLYTRLRLSKEVQLHMWSSVLRRAVGLAAGKMEGGIVVTTRTVEPARLPGGRRPGRADRGSARRLAQLPRRAVNFDAADIDSLIAAGDWRVDDMIEPLPHEGSGPPAAGGSWLVARRIMDEYQLADPGVVTAFYDREAPMQGRDMLLKIRFAGLPLWVGVRIGEVDEQTLELDGRPVRVFGWSYRTLEGHFEQGQMHYELWKWLDSGDVEFRLRAVSRPAARGPLLLRTGFRLFGRTHQLRFYRQVCRRAKRLTEAQLETDRRTLRLREAFPKNS